MDKITLIFSAINNYYSTKILVKDVKTYVEIDDMRNELFTSEKFDKLFDSVRYSLMYCHRLYNQPITNIDDYKIFSVIIQTTKIDPNNTVITTRRYELKTYRLSTRYKLKSYVQTCKLK